MCGRFPDIKCIEVDLGDAAAIDQKLKPLLSGPDAPEILINGVGTSPKYAPSGERWTPWTMPLAHWREVLAVNLADYLTGVVIEVNGGMYMA